MYIPLPIALPKNYTQEKKKAMKIPTTDTKMWGENPTVSNLFF